MSSGDATSGDAGTHITFNVKSSADARHTITIADNMTVADLKQKLSAKEYADIPPDRQRLIYSGRVMKDPETLASYKIKDGNTVHLVKGAASNQQRNPESASASTQVPPNAGVPQNLATGSGTDPLTGLTGARYAGFAQMPGAGMFGPDGGMGAPQSPDEMLQMLENPMVQQQFNEAMNNPHVIRMLQDNPMLRDQPMMREMLNNPEFRRMMFDPQFLRQSMQMHRIMGGGGGGRGMGGGGMPAPGVTDMTPQPDGQQGQAQGQTPGQNQGVQSGAAQGQQGAPNPFGMMGGMGGAQGNPFAMLGAMGGMNPSAQAQPQPQQNANPSTTSPPATSNTATQQPPSPPGSGDQPSQPNQPQQPPNTFAGLFTPQPGQGQSQGNPIYDMANRMMQNPEAMRMAMNAMGGGFGGASPTGQQQGSTGQQEQQDQQPPMNNPFASLFNPAAGGVGGMGGFGAPQQQQDSRPPEEQYAEQLRQLNEMGLHDFNRNVRALRMSGGHVETAIEMLFSGQIP